MPIKPFLALTLPLLLGMPPTLAAAAVSCEEVDGIHSICGLAAPEDLVPAPNGRDLIFGQMAEPGGLFLLDLRDDSVHPLLPEGPVPAPAELWGQADCDQPTSWLGAHGLDLRQRADGRWQLLVVNHTERESVEFFEVLDAEAERPRAVWRGCAIAPAEGNFNDVGWRTAACWSPTWRTGAGNCGRRCWRRLAAIPVSSTVGPRRPDSYRCPGPRARTPMEYCWRRMSRAST